jgi:hypothetical protein
MDFKAWCENIGKSTNDFKTADEYAARSPVTSIVVNDGVKVYIHRSYSEWRRIGITDIPMGISSIPMLDNEGAYHYL